MLELFICQNNFLGVPFYLLSSMMLLCLTFSGIGLFHPLLQQMFIEYSSCAGYSIEATEIQRQPKHKS